MESRQLWRPRLPRGLPPQCVPSKAGSAADPSPRHSQPLIRCGRTDNCTQHHQITTNTPQLHVRASDAANRTTAREDSQPQPHHTHDRTRSQSESSAYHTLPLRTSLRTHPLHSEWPHLGSTRGCNSLLTSPLKRSQQIPHSSGLAAAEAAAEALDFWSSATAGDAFASDEAAAADI